MCLTVVVPPYDVQDWKAKVVTLCTDYGSNLVGVHAGLIAQMRSARCKIVHVPDHAHRLQNALATAWAHMDYVDVVVRRIASFFNPKRLRVLASKVRQLGGKAPAGCTRVLLSFQRHRQTTRWAQSMHRDFIAL